MRNLLTTTRKFAQTGSALLAAGLVASATLAPAQADVKRVWLGVKGVTCPTCAFPLQKGMQKLDGIQSAKLIMKPVHLDVAIKPGVWLAVPQMLQTIKRVGYTPMPEDVRLTVIGTVRKQGEGYAIELDKMKQPLVLALKADDKNKDSAKVTAQIEQAVDKKVTLEGFWQAAPKKGSEESSAGSDWLKATSLVEVVEVAAADQPK